MFLQRKSILSHSLLRFSSAFSTVGFKSFFTSEAASCLLEPSSSSVNEDHADVNWDELGFGLVQTDYMHVMKCSQDEEFTHGELNRFGNIELSPASGVLNYGQGVFEGLKAYRKVDGGVLLFRPGENARRMQKSAERMCMPSPSIQQFINAVKETVLANKRWIPPPGKGSLYVRSLLMGSGPILGMAPAPDYTFLTYVCPVVNYFRGVSLNLLIEDEFHRATRGGTGDVKAITNYSPCLKPQIRAKSRGFSDILFLDSLTKKNLEEVSTGNIFLVKVVYKQIKHAASTFVSCHIELDIQGNYISTPATQGTILAGITRKSIIDLARGFGYQVEERIIPVEELVDAEEVFCTGTAVAVAPVGSITYEGERFEYKTGADTVSQKLKTTLEGIQTGVIEDKMGWTVDMD